jgi:hypothetical protein
VCPLVSITGEVLVSGIIPYLGLNFRRGADPRRGLCADFKWNGLRGEWLRKKEGEEQHYASAVGHNITILRVVAEHKSARRWDNDEDSVYDNL